MPQIQACNPLRRVGSIGSDLAELGDDSIKVRAEDVQVVPTALPESIFEGSEEARREVERAEGAFVRSPSDQCRLFYRRSGKENAPKRVLFVTGLNSTHEAWVRQEPHFSSGDYQCIVMDNRGCGFSESPEGPYTTQQMAGDVLTIADDAKWDTFVLVGHSLGSVGRLRELN